MNHDVEVLHVAGGEEDNDHVEGGEEDHVHVVVEEGIGNVGENVHLD